ncbi:phosphatidylethanolamine N-methyltransferase [Acididesulfobacillus acetoxydans]|uniref:Phosphatidylethanolamine N-methyltransferase n=1 Tax=Acididesulfobacillus acetoxydans TaxID=1561005 RepID=A0A8S0VVH5_9FIRM|nr:RsmB/NOP family class I SAM-dependent RNA methyltransferase [Acididesulfobacillus acetoxydans]CAA7599493.1 phosphatidylethanolamine N-methyltransferase [Acididesulfobacillus acetoxydans]CEJ09278.1 Ribosomal RNA small subunit methyltransferase F [Acididesulfobacillus acetoxydans]
MTTFILPQSFLERMSALLGAEYPAFAASYESPRTNGLRINTLKLTSEAFLQRGLFTLDPIPWVKDGFYYDYTEQLGQHPYHTAGVYYLQEPSAMAAVTYLDPRPGERILDLAAAPGGKSTQIASLLQQRGLLWANEINPSRARVLALNLDRWGSCNTIVSNESPQHLAERLPGYFDRLLLDAPCSGEGMFRKDPSAVREWSPESVRACAQRQTLILESAARLLKPGGRLVYSTCTFSPAENEQTILNFLAKHPEFSPLELSDPAPDFIHSPQLPGAVRLYPHRLRGEGHFVAVLRKEASVSTSRRDSRSEDASRCQRRSENISLGRPHSTEFAVRGSRRTRFDEFPQVSDQKKPGNLPRTSTRTQSRAGSALSGQEAFFSFAGAIFPHDLSAILSLLPGASNPSSYLHFGSHLYLNPAPEVSLEGLHIVRPGLHLGEVKPGRFQPGQALAHTLSPQDVSCYLSLSPSDPRLRLYLRGESWTEPGPDGWMLVGVDEFPLGWAKKVAGQIKNHYPKELRTNH